MCERKKLPGDYALDALAREADRRAKQRGDPSYSYGKLIADTTPWEREMIKDAYRAEERRKQGKSSTHSFFDESGKEEAGG